MKADRRWWNDGRYARECFAWSWRQGRLEVGPDGRLQVTVRLPGHVEMVSINLGFAFGDAQRG